MKKTGVMLVDDELLVIDTILNLLEWDKTPYEIAGYALSGKQALALFDTLQPSIVMLDISIPDMNGLDIARAILEKAPLTRVILLTSYETFEYAREAVSLGVTLYMLKHDITPDNIIKALDTAVNQLRQTMSRTAAQLRMALQQFLMGEKQSTPMINCLFAGDNGYAIVVVHQASTISEVILDKRADGCALAEYMMSCIPAGKDDPTLVQAVDMGERNTAILARMPKKVSRQAQRQSLYKLGASLYEHVARISDAPVYVLLPAVCARADMAVKNYRAMAELSRSSMFFGDKHVLFLDEYYSGCGLQGIPFKEAEYDCVCDALRKAKTYDGINAILDELFDGFAKNQNSTQALRQCVFSLNSILARFRRNSGTPEVLQRLYDEKYGAIYSMRELKALFCEQFYAMSRLAIDSYSDKVQDILREIRKSFAQKISTQTVSRSVGLSEAYLRALLRKETGMTFLDHLTAFRIEMAKAYLKEDDHSIGEVAGMIGYQDASYFSQLFKARVGVYPLEYRSKEMIQ